MVMRWTLAAWASVTQQTIKNCFRKAFGSVAEQEVVAEVTQDQDQSLVGFFSQLVPDKSVTFEEFVSVDDCLVGGDGEDQLHVPEDGDTTEEENELHEVEDVQQVTKKQAFKALSQLVLYNNSESFVPQKVIDQLRHHLLIHDQATKRQTVITDYFSLVSDLN